MSEDGRDLGLWADRLPQVGSKWVVGALKTAKTSASKVLGDLKPTPVPGRSQRMKILVEDTVFSSGVVDYLPQPNLPESPALKVRAQLDSGFGKPMLLTVDLVVADPKRTLVGLRDLWKETGGEPKAGFTLHQKELHAQGVLLLDLLDRSMEALWHNPEAAPIALRARLLAATEGAQKLQLDTRRDLGNQAGKQAGNQAGDQAGKQAGKQAGQRELSARDLTSLPDEELIFDSRDLGFTDQLARPGNLYAKYGAPRSDPTWRP